MDKYDVRKQLKELYAPRPRRTVLLLARGRIQRLGSDGWLT
jgi:hypothetical protein